MAMTFLEIAQFLNISEDKATQLALLSVLPGHPSNGGWETDYREIEQWYIGLSGKEWADLVSMGKIDPIEARAICKGKTSPANVSKGLYLLHENGEIRIISHKMKKNESLNVTFIMNKTVNWKDRKIDAPDNESVGDLIRSQVELVYKCEQTICNSPIKLSLSDNGCIKLELLDDLAEMPQRDREIIRFHLMCYASRYASLFGEKEL